MIAVMVSRELRALWRDGRLWGMGGALVALFMAVGFTACADRDAAERERVAVEQAARHQWDHQGERNPHRAAHFGLYAFKPRSVLSAFEPGVDARMGQALWLEPHKRNMALFPPAADAAPSTGLGEFTPSFVMLALVPLLVGVLGHAGVTQERERGTLRMLHASGVGTLPLLMAKWTALAASVTALLSPALAVMVWAGASSGAAGAAWLLAGVLVVCVVLWSGLTVLVSACCRTSRGALLAFIAVWVAAVFAVPRLATSTVERLHPLPTGAAFWSAIAHDMAYGLPGDGTADERMKAFDAALLAEHRVARMEDLPFGANATRRLFRDAYATRVHALHFQRLWLARFEQQQLRRILTAISPWEPLRAVASSLAGTDLAHREHFEEAAERHRQAFTTLIDEWDRASTKGVTSFESRYAGDAQWQAVPPWQYEAPGVAFAWRTGRADWGLLAAWLLLVAAGVWAGSRRLAP